MTALFVSNNFHRIFEISAAPSIRSCDVAIIDTSMLLRITRNMNCCGAMKSKQPSFLNDGRPIQKKSAARKHASGWRIGGARELLSALQCKQTENFLIAEIAILSAI